MNILLLDDEKKALYDITEKMKGLRPEDNIIGYTDPEQAIAYARENAVQIAFLDMEMPKKSGIEVAKELKEINPQTYVIFVTAHEEYALEAFKVRAGGYILKPASKEELQAELEQMQKYRFMHTSVKIRVQCFGGFEVYSHTRERISFGRKKSKELLAYLIHKKGAAVSNHEMIEILFDGKEDNESTQSSLRKIISDMKKTLSEHGLEDLVIRKRNEMAVNRGIVDCDYYSYLRGVQWAVNAYQYDYMSEYEWAEETNWYLSGMKDKNK